MLDHRNATWITYQTAITMGINKEAFGYVKPVMDGESNWSYFPSPSAPLVVRVVGSSSNVDAAIATRRGGARPVLYQ